MFCRRWSWDNDTLVLARWVGVAAEGRRRAACCWIQPATIVEVPPIQAGAISYESVARVCDGAKSEHPKLVDHILRLTDEARN